MTAELDTAEFVPAIPSAPRWQIIYTLARDYEPGTVITYQALGEALGLDAYRQRAVIRSALRRAGRELLERHQTVLRAEPGVGYRVTTAAERLTLVHRDQEAARRRLEDGHAKAIHVDLGQIQDPEVRKALEATGHVIGLQLEFSRRLQARADRMEAVLASLTTRAETNSQTLEDMQTRLSRLEAGIKPRGT